jgi:shikimate kinase
VSLHRGNLFLVGLMGAGKTTLGRQLARRLTKRFIDADHELEARLGVTIPTIFEIEGEAGFRDREEAMIDELTRLTDVVLATGGGAVLRARSRALLKENGTVLYLHAEPETLWQRLRNARNRPMLQSADPRNRLVELYQLRDPLYREVADHVIESDRDAVMRFVRWLDTESNAAHADAAAAVDERASEERAPDAAAPGVPERGAGGGRVA